MKSVRIMERWRGNGLQHRSLKPARAPPPPRPQVILPARPAPAALSLLDGGGSHRHPAGGLMARSYDLSASTMRALLLPTRRMHLTTPAPSLYVPRGPPPALGLSGRGPAPLYLSAPCLPAGRSTMRRKRCLPTRMREPGRTVTLSLSRGLGAGRYKSPPSSTDPISCTAPC